MKLEDFQVSANHPLIEEEVADVADALAVHPAKLWAVCDIESNGRGARSDNLLTMRFEAHIFFSKTAVDIKGGPNDYNTLLRACAVNEDAALQSASYGMFQIMGFNHAACDCTDAATLVREMCKGEKRQLLLAARFIKNNPAMLAALRKGDWAGFAARYNGSGYRANAYDTKLYDAYRRRLLQLTGYHRLLRDGVEPGADIGRLQQMLNKVGAVAIGVLDTSGHWDAGTKEAVITFQNNNHLAADAIVGPATWFALAEMQ